MKGFLDGFVEGCRSVGCVYLSGETPQLKTKIVHDKLDIAGSLFALLPAGSQAIGTSALAAGDKIVLIESSGPHENGFTSLRDLASRLPQGYRTRLSDGTEYWRAINAPSKLYTPLIQQLLAAGIALTNVENITGHGWLKIMRPSQPFRYRIIDFRRFCRSLIWCASKQALVIRSCCRYSIADQGWRYLSAPVTMLIVSSALRNSWGCLP